MPTRVERGKDHQDPRRATSSQHAAADDTNGQNVIVVVVVVVVVSYGYRSRHEFSRTASTSANKSRKARDAAQQ